MHAHGFRWRTLLVGLMHGMAGCAALLVLAVSLASRSRILARTREGSAAFRRRNRTASCKRAKMARHGRRRWAILFCAWDTHRICRETQVVRHSAPKEPAVDDDQTRHDQSHPGEFEWFQSCTQKRGTKQKRTDR